MLFRSRCNPSSLFFSTLLSLIGLATAASAATISAPLTATYGPEGLRGLITIDDGVDPGNLRITAQVTTTNRADIRGVLAHVANESLLSGLSITGTRIRGVRFDEDGVGKPARRSGLGNNGTACPCDFGLRFPAKSGATVTFTLSHDTQDLTIALFYGQDFAVLASNFGRGTESGRGNRNNGGGRGGNHALLEGRVPNPIPEPSTALLMALGLGGLAYAGRAPGRAGQA